MKGMWWDVLAGTNVNRVDKATMWWHARVPCSPSSSHVRGKQIKNYYSEKQNKKHGNSYFEWLRKSHHVDSC